MPALSLRFFEAYVLVLVIRWLYIRKHRFHFKETKLLNRNSARHPIIHQIRIVLLILTAQYAYYKLPRGSLPCFPYCFTCYPRCFFPGRSCTCRMYLLTCSKLPVMWLTRPFSSVRSWMVICITTRNVTNSMVIFTTTKRPSARS